MVKKSRHMRHVVFGFIASLSLLAFYFTIVGLLQGIDYAIGRFFELWYFMIPLIVGFGFQVGLFVCIRDLTKVDSNATAASGGVSAASMIACCAHHVTDVIPFIGVSAIGVFLLDYQPVFLLLGVVSNAIGIIFMMNIAQKAGVRFKSRFFRSLMKYDFGMLLKITIIAGVILLIVISSVLGYRLYQNYYGAGYKKGISVELPDKCATPSGYTDESWREHMGHHPDRYKECLGG